MSSQNDIFFVAKILDAHGIKGEIKTALLSDQEDRLSDLEEVYIAKESGELYDSKPHAIEALRGHDNSILKLQEIDDRDQALAIKGLYLAVTRDMTYELASDEYFIGDLINLEVFDQNSQKLGTIKDISEGAASSLFIISRPGKKDLLVPAVPDFCTKVDLENNSIFLDLPQGLLDIYE